VNCFRGVGESKGVGLLDMVSMLADKSVMALDMLAVASSRQSAACKTSEKMHAAKGVRIMEGMVAIGFGVVIGINRIIVALPSSSMMGIIGVSISIRVGFLSGLGFVALVVGGIQHAGVSLHV